MDRYRHRVVDHDPRAPSYAGHTRASPTLELALERFPSVLEALLRPLDSSGTVVRTSLGNGVVAVTVCTNLQPDEYLKVLHAALNVELLISDPIHRNVDRNAEPE
jgi:hypothetical protein